MNVDQAHQDNIDGLMHERRNSSALAMELRLSCTNPSIWQHKAPIGYKHHKVTFSTLFLFFSRGVGGGGGINSNSIEPHAIITRNEFKPSDDGNVIELSNEGYYSIVYIDLARNGNSGCANETSGCAKCHFWWKSPWKLKNFCNFRVCK